MPADEIVLFTGATGHVGFATLRSLIDHGYTVRAVVRNDAKAELVRKQPTLKAKPGQLTFVTIADFTVPGSFESAVRGVTYIVHVASPIPDSVGADDDFELSLVKPAVQGTLNVLSAAKKSDTVKRVVITSSVVATVPVPLLLGQQSTEVFGPEYRAPAIPAPYNNMAVVAYIASKVAALTAAEDFVKTERPDFDVIHIHPSYVEGRDDLTTTVAGFQSGTNKLIIDLVTGTKSADPRTSTAVHVEDVALAHVKALNPSVPGNQSFLLNTGGFAWNDAVGIAKELFPQAFEKGLLNDEGSCATSNGCLIDATTTETVLGLKVRGFREMVQSVVGHYLDVLGKEKSQSL
ncbi:hypothetical protein LTR56_008212 [Elasticomyces elasticus]|nr:hypothetical protein LTR56_008212 [Elasticomyces elasticus]KAK3661777.1 hypothetical protein LTR22_007358 [Elasticomyces elasticus]KAK4924382.1 hypothetical protein LTR49_008471 [Elasticomyces elasticus]KAK5762654.1 hypothetical protein LTS12_007246 [Elasticomyces elasticus]